VLAGAPALPADPRVGGPIEEAASPGRALVSESRPVRLIEVSCVLPPGTARHYLLPGEPLTIRAVFESSRPVEGVVFQLDIRSDEGLGLFSTDSDVLGVRCDVQAGIGAFEFRLASVPLLDGAYDVNVGVQTQRGLSDWKEPACRFEVMNPGRATGTVAIPVDAGLVTAQVVAARAEGSVAS
jgi:hypothetical protein